jgi:hypothetical protein
MSDNIYTENCSVCGEPLEMDSRCVKVTQQIYDVTEMAPTRVTYLCHQHFYSMVGIGCVADPATNRRNESSPGDALAPLDAALDLLRGGFKPVILYPKGFPRGETVTVGKEPLGKNWGRGPFGESRIIKDAEFFTRRKCGFGIGICLGPGMAPDGGWLCDIEEDGPEALSSMYQLLGSANIETMGWSSARGDHRLFTVDPQKVRARHPEKHDDDPAHSPFGGGFQTRLLPGLEIRLGGVKPDGSLQRLYSAVPPTSGTDGNPRRWNGVETVAPMPEKFYRVMRAIAECETAFANSL